MNATTAIAPMKKRLNMSLPPNKYAPETRLVLPQQGVERMHFGVGCAGAEYGFE